MCSSVVAHYTLSHLFMSMFYLVVHIVGSWKARMISYRSWHFFLSSTVLGPGKGLSRKLLTWLENGAH